MFTWKVENVLFVGTSWLKWEYKCTLLLSSKHELCMPFQGQLDLTKRGRLVEEHMQQK